MNWKLAVDTDLSLTAAVLSKFDTQTVSVFDAGLRRISTIDVGPGLVDSLDMCCGVVALMVDHGKRSVLSLYDAATGVPLNSYPVDQREAEWVALYPDGFVVCKERCSEYTLLGERVWSLRTGYVVGGPRRCCGYVVVVNSDALLLIDESTGKIAKSVWPSDIGVEGSGQMRDVGVYGDRIVAAFGQYLIELEVENLGAAAPAVRPVRVRQTGLIPLRIAVSRSGHTALNTIAAGLEGVHVINRDIGHAFYYRCRELAVDIAWQSDSRLLVLCEEKRLLAFSSPQKVTVRCGESVFRG